GTPGRTTIEPNMPWASAKYPAVKNSVVVGPAEPPLPKPSPHNPSIRSCRILGSSSNAARLPVVGLYATIAPLPNCPTRRSPLYPPKPVAGAITTAQGESRKARCEKGPTRLPGVSKIQRYPFPDPATSSCLAASCLAKVTASLP